MRCKWRQKWQQKWLPLFLLLGQMIDIDLMLKMHSFRTFDDFSTLHVILPTGDRTTCLNQETASLDFYFPIRANRET
jgi:hypothetical protein